MANSPNLGDAVVAGSKSSIPPPKTPRSPRQASASRSSRTAELKSSPRIMDFRPSAGLTAGLKRVGGRNESVSRLANFAKHGRPVISHRY